MKPDAVYAAIKRNTMLNGVRLNNIAASVNYIAKRGILGDFIECGVWKGGSVGMMAKTLLENKEERILHLFDSFDDICEPSPIDGARLISEVGGVDNAQGRLQPVKGFYKSIGKGGPGNEKDVFDLLTKTIKYPQDKVKIHKGWFQDTMEAVSKGIESVALLRLDCDLYSSTKICLDNLYDKVVVGGVVIVDDYGTYDGCRKAVDEFLARKNHHPEITVVTKDCVYWFKHEKT